MRFPDRPRSKISSVLITRNDKEATVSSNERITRPKLARTEPIRTWSTLFEAPGAQASQDNSKPGAPPRTNHSVSLNDVVSRSVDLGYRVVDEYIRRGQQAARRINDRSYDVQAMTSDVQDLGVRTLQYASDFAALWFDLLQRSATDAALLRPSAAAHGAGNPSPDERAGSPPPADGYLPAGPEPARVKIEIASAQPTEVELDLRPDAAGRRLVVHALRAVDPKKPRLGAVGFRPGSEGQPATVWVRVPPDQPPGAYRGVIIDEENSRPVGTLSVCIAQSPER
jgi:hypothetical protein